MIRPAVSFSLQPISIKRLSWAIEVAKQGGANRALITGIGEPTLAPSHIETYLKELGQSTWTTVALQTNGLRLVQPRFADPDAGLLRRWKALGLSTVIVSTVHFDRELNRKIYCLDDYQYPDLKILIEALKSFGYAVRLSTVMLRGYIDSLELVQQMAVFAGRIGANQITFVPVTRPMYGHDYQAEHWTAQHAIDDSELARIQTFFAANAQRMKEFPHGTVVYKLNGQQVGFSNCLRRAPHGQMRQLIFLPDGRIRPAWDSDDALSQLDNEDLPLL